jgi:hypothetical protein
MLSRKLVAMITNVIKNTGGDDAKRYKKHWWL